MNSFFLLHGFRSIKQILQPREFLVVKKTLFIYIIIGLLEFIGVALLLPAVILIINSNSMPENIISNSLSNYILLDNPKDKFRLILVLFVLIVLKNLIVFLLQNITSKYLFDLSSLLMKKRFESYLGRPFSFYTNNKSVSLLRNITSMPLLFVNSYIIPLVILTSEFILLFFLVITLSLISFKILLLITLSFTPLYLIYSKISKQKIIQSSLIKDKEGLNVMYYAQQGTQAPLEIKVYNKVDYFVNKLTTHAVSQNEQSRILFIINLLPQKVIEILGFMLITLIFGYFIITNSNTADITYFLALFLVVLFRLMPSINKISILYNQFKSGEHTLQYVTDIFTNEENDSKKTKTINNTFINYKRISISNLSFHYENGKQIFRNLNMSIDRGDIIGIVGPSGVGKTSFLKLLLRLYKEQEGGVFVDNKMLSDNLLFEWYNIIGFVPQDVNLLSGTIIENIAFGIEKEDIDYNKLYEAIKIAQLEDFINEIPDGINALVGERGLKISGGQKQRISIARAIYKDSKLLIFDEATSNLDKETEQAITDVIGGLALKGYTIIIIAHKMLALKYCTKVYRLANGMAEEENKEQYIKKLWE